MIKAGFAGGDKPRCLFRACVGRTKHVRMMPGGALEGYDTWETNTHSFLIHCRFVGLKAEEHRGAMLLNYPMEHGIIKNWADMERLWQHVYARENLNVASEDHAV